MVSGEGSESLPFTLRVPSLGLISTQQEWRTWESESLKNSLLQMGGNGEHFLQGPDLLAPGHRCATPFWRTHRS